MSPIFLALLSCSQTEVDNKIDNRTFQQKFDDDVNSGSALVKKIGKIKSIGWIPEGLIIRSSTIIYTDYIGLLIAGHISSCRIGEECTLITYKKTHNKYLHIGSPIDVFGLHEVISDELDPRMR